MLAHVQSTVGREHMEMVAINVKESRREFLGVIRANKGIELTYVHDHDKGAVTDQYGVSSLPNMFIIDREGRVAHVHRGYSEQVFQRFIEEILALLPPEGLARPALPRTPNCRRSWHLADHLQNGCRRNRHR